MAPCGTDRRAGTAWPCWRAARSRCGLLGETYVELSPGDHRGAMLPETDALAGESFLAIGAIDQRAENARIFLAAPLLVTLKERRPDVARHTEKVLRRRARTGGD